MKITKRRLKRIIREEYTRLKNQGLIKESWGSGEYHPGRDFSAPDRVSRSRMQMPNNYTKKDILRILQIDGEQKIERLYRSFQDASSREDFDIAVNDLIRSGSIIYTGHPEDPPEAISINPQYKQNIGECNMKITKRQLKRIIREERNKLLKEEWTEEQELRGDQHIVFAQILEWMRSGITASMLRAEIEDAEQEITRPKNWPAHTGDDVWTKRTK